MHLQNVSLNLARTEFYRYVDEVIFKEHEIRTLQSLLQDYKTILRNYGYPVGDIRSSYLKELLESEYKDKIGFQERSAKKLGELVYDKKGGGDYIQYAVDSLGITDEQLIKNVVLRISKEIKETPELPWPPTIEELEKGDEISPLLCKFLTQLKYPNRLPVDIRPEVLSLASLITQYVTGRRTATSINLSMAAHGMTRSKVLVEILRKSGVFISYPDIQLLYDFWALQDAEVSEECPAELAEGKPAICICDNDDFVCDTLTGESKGAHRTNVMYVQPEHYFDKELSQVKPTVFKKNEVTQKLKQKCENLKNIAQYVCPPGASSEPPIRGRVRPPSDNCLTQRTRSVIHSLCRGNNECIRPEPSDQRVPTYSGFQSCLDNRHFISKPLYHATYPESPTKHVLYHVMRNLVNAIRAKKMPFAFLTGDLPTHKLIVQLKAENPVTFEKITPILGAFHQQMSYMHSLYKRFKGSGMADTLVEAGVVVGGSVDAALRGNHYRRGVHCIIL